MNALVIGGTRFLGRHTVAEFTNNGYDVTIFNRGKHPNPFSDDPEVVHFEGDRNKRRSLVQAANRVNPSVVIDTIAYYPDQVKTATDVFDSVNAYILVSSGDAYDTEEIPKKEDSTDLETCTDRQAQDDSDETYGNRKAECDREVFRAAEAGIRSMSVRPCIIYGPYDYTERMDYWIHRVNNYNTVLVPGDGQNIWHRAYVKDVARALRIVAENGKPGEAYNVGDQTLLTLDEMVQRIAEMLSRNIKTICVNARELDGSGLSYDEFVLYRDYPHILDTTKLESLGWNSTNPVESYRVTVEESIESGRTGEMHDPGRESEEDVIKAITPDS